MKPLEWWFHIEELCKCGHKKGWHHANMKFDDQLRVCFGIGCMCTGFTQDGEKVPGQFCPECGALVEIEPDEKSDGTILGSAYCPKCNWCQ